MTAQITNLTGTVSGDEFPNANMFHFSGAFYHAGVGYDSIAGGGVSSVKIGFDASRVSSIYSNNTDSLNPDSLTTFFLIRY